MIGFDERLNMVSEKQEESRMNPFLEIKNIGRKAGWGKLLVSLNMLCEGVWDEGLESWKGLV